MAAPRSTFKSPAVRVMVALLAVGILGLFGAMLIRRESRTLRLPLIPTSAASLGFHARDTAFPTDKFDAIELPSKAVGWRTYPVSYAAVWINANGTIGNLVFSLGNGTKQEIASQCAMLCEDLGIDPQKLSQWISDPMPELSTGVGLSPGEPGITVQIYCTLDDDRPWRTTISIYYPSDPDQSSPAPAKPPRF